LLQNIILKQFRLWTSAFGWIFVALKGHERRRWGDRGGPTLRFVRESSFL
jgi:hypothetical protein